MVLGLFFLLNFFTAFIILRIFIRRISRLSLKTQDLQEKSNILFYQNRQEAKSRLSLQKKIMRYDNLKNIIEEINQYLDIEKISDSLTRLSFSLIAADKGACLFFLVESLTQVKLTLFKTKREERDLIIKEKEGDLFDFWVSKHTSPLFVENTRRDFRFDLEKINIQDARPVSSLISAPMVSNRRLLGILRLDNPQAEFYSQDDLRLLATIADLGAMALENALLFQKTQDLATHDSLTSFYTKAFFLECLHREYKRSARQGAALSLLMIDIDLFKNYNDRFGHAAGDIVLQALSQNITESLKPHNPIISRFGGEEFCVILPGIGKKEAVEIAEGLRKKTAAEKILLRRQETNITVSIGIASFPGDSCDEEGLILKADQAMYTAKRKGRNQVCSI